VVKVAELAFVVKITDVVTETNIITLSVSSCNSHNLYKFSSGLSVQKKISCIPRMTKYS